MATLLATELLQQRGHSHLLTGVILVAGHADDETPDKSTQRREQIKSVEQNGLACYVNSELETAYFSHRTKHGYQSDLQLTLKMAQSQGDMVFARHVNALIERPDLKNAARFCPAPIQVIAGAADKLVPVESARAMAHLAEQGQLEILPDCGHMIPLERPDRICRAIERFASSQWGKRKHVS